MRTMRSFLLSIPVLVSVSGLVDDALAKAWKGIVPLHSRRMDVERILATKLSGSGIERLTVGDSELVINFTTEDFCSDRRLPGGWNVPKDTVISMTVRPLHSMRFSELGLDISRFRRVESDVRGMISLENEEEGYSIVVQEGLILNTAYYPSSRDRALRCQNLDERANHVRQPCPASTLAFDPTGSYYLPRDGQGDYLAFDHMVIRAEERESRLFLRGVLRSLDGKEYAIQPAPVENGSFEFQTSAIDGVKFVFHGHFLVKSGVYASDRDNNVVELLEGNLERLIDGRRNTLPTRFYLYQPTC